MKKLLMVCLALLMGAGMCAAAEKPAAKKTVTTVFVTDIDCDHCVKKIMNNVPSLGKGIKDVKVDLSKKEVTVVYDGTKNNDANIVKGLASLKVAGFVIEAGGPGWALLLFDRRAAVHKAGVRFAAPRRLSSGRGFVAHEAGVWFAAPRRLSSGRRIRRP